MVEAAEQAERGAADPEREPRRLDGRAGREPDRVEELVSRDVGGIDAEDRRQRLRARERLEVLGGVDPPQLVEGRASRSPEAARLPSEPEERSHQAA